MKYFAVLAFVATVIAQSMSSNSSTAIGTDVTVTSYLPGCSTVPAGNYSITSTTTGTITSTLPCHKCQMTDGIYTTYTTVYDEICPTGLGPKTYVITESCSETDQPRPSTYVPQGFMVTTIGCGVCAEKTVTLTTPANTMTAAPTPVITMVPVNTSTVCHTCNQTITSVQYGEAVSISLGLSILTLFSLIAGAVLLL